jgi:hypothetical protein
MTKNEYTESVQVGNVTAEILVRHRVTDWSQRRPHDRDRSTGKTRVYFFHEGENVIQNFGNRHARPVDVYKSFLPEVEKIVDGGLGKARWDRYAGCSLCPCSPGFVCETPGFDIWVTMSEEAPKIDETKVEVAQAYSAALAIDPTMPWNMRGNGKAIKGVEAYDRREITASLCIYVERKGTRESLVRGSEFYIRPAGSKPGMFRIVLPAHGATKVFSIDADTAAALNAGSRRV